MFVTLFTKVFGASNSIVGVVVLLSVMVFRYADMGIQNRHGVCSLLLIFAIATPIFGLPGAIFLRIFNNAIGSLYGWLFDTVMGKISEVFRERTAAIAD